MPPRKSHPKHIDQAYPQVNFVEACYENKNDKEGFSEYMYPRGIFSKGIYSPPDTTPKAHGYGHSIGQRAGKLRLSGKAGAHRIGKR